MKNRVTFVIKSLAGAGGGAERVLSLVIHELTKRDWDIEVVSFDAPGAKPFYALPTSVLWARLGVVDPVLGGKTEAILRRAYLLRKRISVPSTSPVVAFMSSSCVPAAVALIGVNRPFVVSEHIVIEYYNKRYIERALLARSFYRADAITMISEKIKTDYAERWPRLPYRVIPNPIDCSLRQCDLHYPVREAKRIIAAGSFIERKNFQKLIDVFGGLVDQFPDWNLVIYGDGPLRSGLEKLVKLRGLETRVQLPGFTEDLAKELGHSEIFAMPSTLESFGMVTLEAMSMGLPAIGLADCPGTNEVIQDGLNGLLVRGEEIPFRCGLRRLMEDPKLRERLGRAGLDSALKFDRSHVGKQWNDMLLALQ